MPLDGFTDSGLKGLGRFPAQLKVDLGGIDRIPAVVSGTIGQQFFYLFGEKFRLIDAKSFAVLDFYVSFKI